MSARTIDEWKQLLIGNTYNLLTVTDVVKVDSKIMSVCICKCGNIKYAEPFRVFHGNIKSCGCLNNSENLSLRHTERHKRKLEQLKSQLINTRSGSLVVQDVIISFSNSIMCVCKCDCGVVKEIPPKRLKRLKSCGCRSSVSLRLDVDQLKSDLIGTTVNRFTIIDVYRDSKTSRVMIRLRCECGTEKTYTKKLVFGNKLPLSCGCHHKTEEYKAAHKISESCRKRISDGRKQFYLEHQEEKLAQSNRMKDFYNRNPEYRRLAGERISNWFKSDKDGVKKWTDKLRQWYRDNSDKVASRAKKRSEWCKNNPDKVAKTAEKVREYWRNHPEKVAQMSEKVRETAKEKSELFFDAYRNCQIENRKDIDNEFINSHRDRRLEYNIDPLLNVIHSDYINALKSGDIASYDIIKTRCPLCGEYAEHSFCNVFSFGKGDFKNSSPPLCKSCKAKQTSSQTEQEIADYISTFYDGECIRNSREIISPLELDLYYPEKKIAIEFNGDYWHDENHKPKDYHYNKFRACRDLNVTLVSIFESDWNRRKKDIKEYILDLFSGIENKLSFNEDHTLMNNNYPLPLYKYNSDNYIDHYYITRKSKVYTCGYSVIISDIKP